MPQTPTFPTVFVAFGVTGELMKRKILPALAKLREKNELPENFKIVGISRRPAHELKELFGTNFYHIQGDANEAATYTKLSETLASLGAAQKIFYISTSPALYKTIFTHLLPLAENSKLMIEKPFGVSGKDADELNKILHKRFTEDQIYRADHYLGKESLQFRNIPIQSIQKIEAYFCEQEGVEKRGASYDAVGALRDVGQNHLLEMLAVTLMQNRVDFLQELSDVRITNSTHEQDAVYGKVLGVAPRSKTETGFSLTFRWRGIPITLKGGKYAQEDKKEIVITLIDGRVERFPIGSNTTQDEYERLILDCLRGDHTLFVSKEEIMLLWRFIDPIIKMWYQ